MSVINDMLRDLETRKAPAAEGMVSSSQVQSMIEPDKNTLAPKLVLLSVVLVVLGVGYYLFASDKQDLQSGQLSEPNVATEAIPEDEQSVAEESSVESAIDASKPLAQAPRAEKPKPKQSESQAAKSNTVRPATKAASATQKPQVAAQQKAPPVPVKKLEKSTPEKTEVANSKPTAAPLVDKPIPAKAAAVQKPISEATSTPPKTISAKALDSENAKLAQSQFQKGRDQLGYQTLNNFIADNTENLKSQTVLLTYLLRDQRLDEAGELFAQLPVGSNLTLRQLKARWHAARGENEQAIFILHSQLPEIDESPEYYELLASYYQQFGFPDKAAAFYTQLVQFDYQVANWWAGLAVAMDSSGQNREARIAYEQASRLPGLRPELANFVAQRVQQLTP